MFVSAENLETMRMALVASHNADPSSATPERVLAESVSVGGWKVERVDDGLRLRSESAWEPTQGNWPLVRRNEVYIPTLEIDSDSLGKFQESPHLVLEPKDGSVLTVTSPRFHIVDTTPPSEPVTLRDGEIRKVLLDKNLEEGLVIEIYTAHPVLHSPPTAALANISMWTPLKYLFSLAFWWGDDQIKSRIKRIIAGTSSRKRSEKQPLSRRRGN